MASTVISAADFLLRFPEFAGVPEPQIDVHLEDAEADTSATVFGDTHARAISLLAAHRMGSYLDEDGNYMPGQGGALQAATVDGVASTYVVPEGIKGTDLDLWGTGYGQQFIQLRNRFVAGLIGVR